MTQDALNKKRDELAKSYSLDKFPIQNIQTTRGFTQEVNFARRESHCSSFKDGFDAAVELLQKENEQLKLELKNKDANIEKAVEALRFSFDAMEHALHLGHCGEGSTKGFITDAAKKNEAALKDIEGMG